MRISAAATWGISGRSPEHVRESARPSLLRALLIAGILAAATLAALGGRPAAYLSADPALAHLLRAMALIKAALVAGAIGILLWRFGYPLSQRIAGVYLVSTWVMTGATMLVWQLSLLVPAAVAFHVGAVAVLLAAWRDGRAILS